MWWCDSFYLTRKIITLLPQAGKHNTTTAVSCYPNFWGRGWNKTTEDKTGNKSLASFPISQNSAIIIRKKEESIRIYLSVSMLHHPLWIKLEINYKACISSNQHIHSILLKYVFKLLSVLLWAFKSYTLLKPVIKKLRDLKGK